MASNIKIDREMRPILDQMLARAAARPPGTAVSVVEMRQRAEADLAQWNRGAPPLPCVEDRVLSIGEQRLPIRIYKPVDTDAPRPTLVYCHGGGWVIGSLDTEDYSLRLLARESGCNIVSVDYRLAPEHKCPAAVLDCVAVIDYLRRHGQGFGIDEKKLALGGASAGANIALAAAIVLRDRGNSPIRLCLLFYGAFSPYQTSATHRRFGNGDYFLSSEAMRYFWDCYLEDAAQAKSALANPFCAKLEGLPPMHLLAAELDPLLDDTLALASELEAAGVPVTCSLYAGVVHGFTVMARDLGVGRQALDDAARSLGDRLMRAESPVASDAGHR